MKFRVYHLLVLMIVVALAALAMTRGMVGIADGWYDLTVSLDAATAAETESVSYMPLSGEDTAREVVARVDEYLPEMRQQNSTAPITISVGYSFRIYTFGRRSEGSQQYSQVVVVRHLKDGGQAVHLVEIPHREVTRQVVVKEANRVGEDR